MPRWTSATRSSLQYSRRTQWRVSCGGTLPRRWHRICYGPMGRSASPSRSCSTPSLSTSLSMRRSSIRRTSRIALGRTRTRSCPAMASSRRSREGRGGDSTRSAWTSCAASCGHMPRRRCQTARSSKRPSTCCWLASPLWTSRVSPTSSGSWRQRRTSGDPSFRAAALCSTPCWRQCWTSACAWTLRALQWSSGASGASVASWTPGRCTCGR
mmetsp:Transcript_106864/g.309129  ORF Transcript_106864/g.309129 Transcript_106864/m.309129 type:complete len:212 (-) Transcript_106864:169-804(-)